MAILSPTFASLTNNISFPPSAITHDLSDQLAINQLIYSGNKGVERFLVLSLSPSSTITSLAPKRMMHLPYVIPANLRPIHFLLKHISSVGPFLPRILWPCYHNISHEYLLKSFLDRIPGTVINRLTELWREQLRSYVTQSVHCHHIICRGTRVQSLNHAALTAWLKLPPHELWGKITGGE